MSLLLTLDLSTHTGWSKGTPGDRSFTSGVYTLPKTDEDIGSYLTAFWIWLQGILEDVSFCVFESPILPRDTSLATCRKLYGLCGVTEMICHDRNIKCMELSNSTLKSFMGVQRLKDGPDAKEQMIAIVEQYGYRPKTHDEADAIAIRLYIIHKFFPEHRSAFSIDLGLLGAVADN